MAQDKALTIKEYMSAPAVLAKMQEMLQTKDSVRQFSTAVLSIAGSDLLLATAEPRSLFNAALTAASLNLPINKNLGFAHIIGYKNNKKKDANGNPTVEAQFQLGARGFKELAQRSGRYKIIHETDVREGELKGINRLTGEIEFIWNNDEKARLELPVIGYLSYFKLDNGFENTLYMSEDELKRHAETYSQAYKWDINPKNKYGASSPWSTNFEAMAKKTVMKLNISKNGPLDINLQQAVNADQAVIRDDGSLDYVDGHEIVEAELADDDQEAAIIDVNKED